MERRTYTAKTASEEWGISEPKIYELLNRSDCPAFRMGRKWIIPKDRFDEWMDKLATERAHVI